MTTRRVREVGDSLPDVGLVDHTGQVWRPSQLAGSPALLIFHRHLA